MNNSQIQIKSYHFKHAPSHQTAASSIKAIVFCLDKLHLALRIEQVYKVLSQTLVHGSGLNNMGIAHVGEREVTVVDLNQQLSRSSDMINGTTRVSYLVVVQNTVGELFGIPVTTVPVLKEVPLANIRVLPESYRRHALLTIASHVGQIPDQEIPLTIFLLDVDRIMEVCQ